jgi:hypothetical protein
MTYLRLRPAVLTTRCRLRLNVSGWFQTNSSRTKSPDSCPLVASRKRGSGRLGFEAAGFTWMYNSVSVNLKYFTSPISPYQASLTMPARVKNFFVFFVLSFLFFGHTTPFTPKSGLICSVKLCFDDHGSFVIFRSVSVRPKHLCDPNFDHDY